MANSSNVKKTVPTQRLSFSDKIRSLLGEVGLISLLGLAGYLFISLTSYSPRDPGPSHTGSSGEIENLGGYVGAWLADLVFLLFGRPAFLILALCCILVWRLYRQRSIEASAALNYVFIFLGFVLALVGFCGLEQIYFPTMEAFSVFPAGGILGQFIGQALSAAFGIVGASLILIGLFITGITLVLHVSWFAVMDRIGYEGFRFFGWVKQKIETIKDIREGGKTKKKRKDAVREFGQVMSEKKPPKIEPIITPPAQSDRRQKEQQRSLIQETGDQFSLPKLSLLDSSVGESQGYSREALEAMSRLLVKKLKDFNVDITVDAVQPGPVITRFEIEPSPGTKASQIVGLSKDLARSLSVFSVRVVENIPGKSVIGIEIPNEHREIVRLVDGLASQEYERSTSPLTLVLGKDISGLPVVTDLIRMPHVLIAGTTGSGKSVCVNALILSLLYKSTPDQVKMIMVDPKFLELSVYDGIPHLLAPVVTDMNKAANALRWCIGEMDRRFRLMAAIAVRNISGYNKKVIAGQQSGNPLYEPISPDSDGPKQELVKLPYIVVIVDELADLMMVAGKKIEEIIIRIAQRARAAGIHLVLATQRPSVDVVTGLIKANVPTRIAFQVSSRVDSRTVLDQMGAEQLLGQGDMLFLPPGSGFTQRVHGSFVSDGEVNKIVAKLKENAHPVYVEGITSGDANIVSNGGENIDDTGEDDPLYDDAVSFVTQSRKASISAVQRALRVGYNRAARMIDCMEQSGVVSAPDSGKREVLAPPPPE